MPASIPATAAADADIVKVLVARIGAGDIIIDKALGAQLGKHVLIVGFILQIAAAAEIVQADPIRFIAVFLPRPAVYHVDIVFVAAKAASARSRMK